MAFWMVCTCPEGAMFEILLQSDEFKDIKNLQLLLESIKAMDIPDLGWCP